MKSLEIKILFKSGVKESYVIKSEHLDYENIKSIRELIGNGIKNEIYGVLEFLNLESGKEAVINIRDVAAAEFGNIKKCDD